MPTAKRTKTPTSIYLANRGFKVANIPIVVESPPPPALFGLKHPLVVGLTTAPERLDRRTLRSEVVLVLLVSLGAPAAGQPRSFMVTHSMTGSRVRPVRSNVLPAGTRMTVHEQDAAIGHGISLGRDA